MTHWQAGDGGPGRKFYDLSPSGRRHLADRTADWEAFTALRDAFSPPITSPSPGDPSLTAVLCRSCLARRLRQDDAPGWCRRRHDRRRLAEVEAHCRDSGESATEAFGPRRPMRAVSPRRWAGRRPPAAGYSALVAMFVLRLSRGGARRPHRGRTGRAALSLARVRWSGSLFAGTVVVLPTLRMRGLSRQPGRRLDTSPGHWLRRRPSRGPCLFAHRAGADRARLHPLPARRRHAYQAPSAGARHPRDPVTGRTQPRDRALALLFPLIVLMPTLSAIDRFGPLTRWRPVETGVSVGVLGIFRDGLPRPRGDDPDAAGVSTR